MSNYSFQTTGNGPAFLPDVVCISQRYKTSETVATRVKEEACLGGENILGGGSGFTKTWTFANWFTPDKLATPGDSIEITVTVTTTSDAVSKTLTWSLGNLVLDTVTLPNSTALQTTYTLKIARRDTLTIYVGSVLETPTGKTVVSSVKTPDPVLSQIQNLVFSGTNGASATTFIWTGHIKTTNVVTGIY